MNREKLKENFKSKGIEVIYFDYIEEAKEYILTTISETCTVGIGHSATLQRMDIVKQLIERGNTVFDKELAKDHDECVVLKKKALTADWYVTGSNAVSEDGRIVNVDHSGNRAAAITFGPDKVIIVVGINKVTSTLADAVSRVKNIACPLNAKRSGYNPPCVELKRCVDCSSIERVCNTLSIIEGQSDKERMKLIIVNQEMGF